MSKKPSFFERLTGGVTTDETDLEITDTNEDFMDEVEESIGEGELSVDMYQTPDKIIVEAMIAGVKPEDLDVHITRDMVTIKGSRNESKTIKEEDYFHKELYWGSFQEQFFCRKKLNLKKPKRRKNTDFLLSHFQK